MSRLRTLLGSAAAALALSASVTYGAPQDDGAEPRGSRADAVRERWSSMDSSERSEFKKRLAQLKEMSPDEQRFLRERAAELEDRMNALRAELPPELGRRLGALDPKVQRELLHEYLIERDRARGMRLRAHLPEEVVKRLESAPPERRAEILHEFHRGMRHHNLQRFEESMRGDEIGGPDGQRFERLEGLEGDERARGLLEMKRERLRGRVAKFGPPPGVEDEEWKRLDGLPLEKFFESWGHRRASGARWSDEHRDREPLPQGRWVHRGILLDELTELARPTMDDLLSLSDLTPRERRDRAAGQVRKRCEAFIEKHGILDEGTRAKLGENSDQRYVDELRHLIGRMSSPRGGGRFGPGGAEKGPRFGEDGEGRPWDGRGPFRDRDRVLRPDGKPPRFGPGGPSGLGGPGARGPRGPRGDGDKPRGDKDRDGGRDEDRGPRREGEKDDRGNRGRSGDRR